MDVEYLNQGGSLTLLPISNIQEKHNSQGTGDVELGSRELDLSDYLIARMESDSEIPSHPVNPDPVSSPSEDSYMDCSTESEFANSASS